MPETTTQAPPATAWMVGRYARTERVFYQFLPTVFTTKREAERHIQREYLNYYEVFPAEEYEKKVIEGKAFVLTKMLADRVMLAADKDDASPRLLRVAAMIDQKIASRAWVAIRPGWLSTEEGQDMLWTAIQINREIGELENGSYHAADEPDTYTAREQWSENLKKNLKKQLKKLTKEMVVKAGAEE